MATALISLERENPFTEDAYLQDEFGLPKKPASVSVQEIEKEKIEDVRKNLLASLRGQTIQVPDLRHLFRNWPTKTNPEVDRMRQDIRQWLDKYGESSAFLSFH